MLYIINYLLSFFYTPTPKEPEPEPELTKTLIIPKPEKKVFIDELKNKIKHRRSL